MFVLRLWDVCEPVCYCLVATGTAAADVHLVVSLYFTFILFNWYGECALYLFIFFFFFPFYSSLCSFSHLSFFFSSSLGDLFVFSFLSLYSGFSLLCTIPFIYLSYSLPLSSPVRFARDHCHAMTWKVGFVVWYIKWE